MRADDDPLNPVVGSAVRIRALIVNGVYVLFARVLDYPGAETSAEVSEFVAQLDDVCSEAALFLRKFETEIRAMTLGELQELYTSTFDMRPDRTTNLGCHLFGEDVRRNIFMAQLKDRMESRQIPLGCELPDHLSLVLRLLAAEGSEDEAQTLIRDCLAPAVTRILSTFDENPNPYAGVLQALLLVLNNDPAVAASAGCS